MTPRDYEKIIARLGLSQSAAGRFLGHHARTSRSYVSGESPVPLAYEMLLRLMADRNITPKEARDKYSSKPWRPTPAQLRAMQSLTSPTSKQADEIAALRTEIDTLKKEIAALKGPRN